MTRKKIALAFVSAMSLTVIALAQENGTLVLRSGEKVSAQLMDLGGVGFTVKVDGQERRYPTNEVAAIDFTGGGNLSNSDWDKLGGGGQVLVLKSGETITGQLIDIGGSSPLRMTFRTSSGERDFPSSDIARIIMARPENTNSSSSPAANTGSPAAQGVTVSSQQQWTPTGVAVRRGDWVTFNTSGNIRIGGEGNPTAGPDGLSAQAPGAPLANAPAAALIGRIGNSAPFLIGSRNRVQMPAAGQLFLGVNDGHLPDNDGAFQVQVTREAGALRR